MAEEQKLIPLASTITAHCCAGCTCPAGSSLPIGAGNNGAGSKNGHVQVDLSDYDDVGPCVSDVIATNLQELNSGNYEKLRIAVQDWEKTLETFQERRPFREVQVNAFRNEIYQVIGFYIVFQGVLFTVVAQSSMLRCQNWWTSFSLSLLTSLVTIGVVLQKLSYLLVRETTMASERASAESCSSRFLLKYRVVNCAKELKKRINNVILNVGPRNFDFNRHARDGTGIYFSVATRHSVKLYGYVVVTVLLCFSAISLVSSWRLLCKPGIAPP